MKSPNRFAVSPHIVSGSQQISLITYSYENDVGLMIWSRTHLFTCYICILAEKWGIVKKVSIFEPLRIPGSGLEYCFSDFHFSPLSPSSISAELSIIAESICVPFGRVCKQSLLSLHFMVEPSRLSSVVRSPQKTPSFR